MSTATLEQPKPAAHPVESQESLYEVVNGQRVEKVMSAYATWIASRLGSRMNAFAEQHNLGTAVTEMLFILDAEINLRRRPDVAFVSRERWPLDRPIPEAGDWEIIPNLTVEVVSRSDIFEEVIAKIREYFRYGVEQAWVVLPMERQVYVYSSPTQATILSADKELDGGRLLPGFRLALTSLFQRPMVTEEASSA